LTQGVLTGDRLLLCMGLFSIFLVGSHRDAKPHMPARPSLYRNGAPRPMKMGTIASP